jgi:hypothetical protein
MAAVLKTLFPNGRVKHQLYPRHPGMALAKKDPTFSGENMSIPIVHESSNGASATFATAQANKDASSMVKFLLTTVEDYSLASVTRKVMLQTRDNKGARLKAIEHAHKMALYAAGRSISHAFFRDGEGVLGKISSDSTVASTTIKLADPSDVVHFRKGMKVVASEDVGGTLRDSGDAVTITAVNRATGELTAGANWATTISALAVGDSLYREGDARNGGSTRLKMTGLLGWLPITDPSPAESFFGVDRSVDRTRLAGFATDKSDLPFEEALIEAQSEINVESLGVDTMLCNNRVKRLAVKALGTKVQYNKRPAVDEKGPIGSIGFETIRIEGDKGPIDLLADPDCPATNPDDATEFIAFFLRAASWTLYSMLDAPHIFDEGTAQQDLREASADAYEGRVGAYLQLGPTEDDAGPGDSGVARLPSA